MQNVPADTYRVRPARPGTTVITAARERAALYPNTTTLDFRAAHMIEWTDVCEVVKLFPLVHTLNITNTTYKAAVAALGVALRLKRAIKRVYATNVVAPLLEPAICALASSFPTLEEVVMMHSCTDRDLRALSSSSVKNVTISYSRVTNVALVNFLERSGVERFSARGVKGVDSLVMRTALHGARALEYLDVAHCTSITDAAFRERPRSDEALRDSLALCIAVEHDAYPPCFRDAFVDVAHFYGGAHADDNPAIADAVASLAADDALVTPCAIRDIAIDGCTGVTATGVANLVRRLTNARKLSLRNTALDNAGAASLICALAARTEEAPRVQLLDVSFTRVESRMLARLVVAANPETVILEHANADGRFLRAIRGAQNLRRIAIISCPRVDDAGLRCLLRDHALTRIELRNLRVYDEAFTDLADEDSVCLARDSLTAVSIAACMVTHNVLIDVLSQCRAVVDVAFNENSEAGDKGFFAPERVSHVQRLDLVSCDLSDSQLEGISLRTPDLCIVDLSGNPLITFGALERLVRRCPGLRTIHLDAPPEDAPDPMPGGVRDALISVQPM